MPLQRDIFKKMPRVVGLIKNYNDDQYNFPKASNTTLNCETMWSQNIENFMANFWE